MQRVFAITVALALALAILPDRAAAQAIRVGQGAPNSQPFVDAYNRRGGQSNLGQPINPAHRWGPGWAQDLRGGRAGDASIMLADGAGTAYVLHGEIWKKYRDGGGVDRCGYPTSDEMGGNSSRGTPFALVTTPQCLIYYLMGGSASGRTVWAWGLVMQKYRVLGAQGGVLGLPIADEQDGPTSPYGTTGRFQRFENGSIEFARGGQRPMTPFYIRGDTYQKYAELGYSGGWLGWPIGDEAQLGGQSRQEFEGGYITWDPVNHAAAQRRSVAGSPPPPQPGPVVPTPPQPGPRTPPAGAIEVGQGAPNPQAFVVAYNRRGGQPTLGQPITPAHRWGPGWAQDFRGGRAGDASIMLADGAGTAYVLHGEIWKKYGDGGGVDRCGYPTSDEMGGSSSRGTPYAMVTASQCMIYYLMGGPSSGRTVWTWGLVMQKYRALGAHGGVLGLPQVDEQDGPMSPYGTPGRFQRFENGSIEFTRGGQRPMTPFSIRGDTYQKYAELGYSGGWLGWPIGDEVQSGSQYRQEFEGGFIVWDPVNHAVAQHRGVAGSPPPPQPGPVVPTPPQPGPIVPPPPQPGPGTPQAGVNQVGQGAPSPQAFVDAYNRRGGQPTLGQPINPAHRWGPGWAQDFRGGRAGDASIMLADGAGTAYVLHGEIWKKYRDGGGVDRCGYPTSDETGGNSSRGTPYASVSARGCLIYYLMGGPSAGRTVWTWGIVMQKYRAHGAQGGALGLPIVDEQDGPTSPYGTAGRFQRFENGSIEFARGGQRSMIPFYVRGDTYQKYAELGYSGGWLGWPIGDEGQVGGQSRQEFEGGYITWDPTTRAVAHRRPDLGRARFDVVPLTSSQPLSVRAHSPQVGPDGSIAGTVTISNPASIFYVVTTNAVGGRVEDLRWASKPWFPAFGYARIENPGIRFLDTSAELRVSANKFGTTDQQYYSIMGLNLLQAVSLAVTGRAIPTREDQVVDYALSVLDLFIHEGWFRTAMVGWDLSNNNRLGAISTLGEALERNNAAQLSIAQALGRLGVAVDRAQVRGAATVIRALSRERGLGQLFADLIAAPLFGETSIRAVTR